MDVAMYQCEFTNKSFPDSFSSQSSPDSVESESSVSCMVPIPPVSLVSFNDATTVEFNNHSISSEDLGNVGFVQSHDNFSSNDDVEKTKQSFLLCDFVDNENSVTCSATESSSEVANYFSDSRMNESQVCSDQTLENDKFLVSAQTFMPVVTSSGALSECLHLSTSHPSPYGISSSNFENDGDEHEQVMFNSQTNISNQSSMSPINMDEQEAIKAERKRIRNRVAASKCRKRKLERISRLEEKVTNLKLQNHELSTSANLLRQQVADLKSKVLSHVKSGCRLMMSQQQLVF